MIGHRLRPNVCHFLLYLAIVLSIGWGKGPCTSFTPHVPGRFCSTYYSGCGAAFVEIYSTWACAGGYVDCNDTQEAGPVMATYDIISTSVGAGRAIAALVRN